MNGGVALARKLRGTAPGAAPTGVNHRRYPNAYSAACLQCRDLLLRRARLAARLSRGQDRRARPRPSARSSGSSTESAPARAAATEGQPDAGRPRPASTRATCCAATSSATRRATARRWRGACAATRARTGSARTSPRSRAGAAPPAASCACGWHSPPHRAVLLSPSGRRIGVGKRRGPARHREAAVFTADLPRAAEPRPRRRLAFAVG